MGSNGNNATLGAASSARWPDLYALLGVTAEADEQLLRQRIRDSYMEASANVDHRNMERRIHYQAMAERVLPQCRRILLNNEARAAYDEQTELHRQGLPGAIDFAAFVNTALRTTAPTPPDFKDLSTLPAMVSEPNKSEARRKEEMEQARALVESLVGVPYEGEEVAPNDPASAPPASSSSASQKAKGRKSSATSSAARQFGDRIPQGDKIANGATAANGATSEPLPAIRHSPNDAIAAPPASTSESVSSPPATAPSSERAPSAALGKSLRSASTQNHSSTQSDISRSDASTSRADNGASRASARRESSRQTLPPEPEVAPPALSWDDLPTEIMPEGEASAAPATSTTAWEPATPTADENSFVADQPATSAFLPDTNTAQKAVNPEPATVAPAPVSPVTAPVAAATTSAGAAPAPLPGAMPIPPVTAPSSGAEAPAEEYRARVIYGPRVTLGDESRASRRNRGRDVANSTLKNLFIGVTAALLTIFIMKMNQAPVVNAIPLRITYASELAPVMAEFEKSFEKRGGVDLQMSPMDAREGMQDALGTRGGASPDVWIPSEALWSDRYNEVAASKGRMAIKTARALALSPMVLVARAERSQVLKSRFPNRVIGSWEALRSAVQSGAAGHFGMTNPQTSATGAVARFFMAREWADKNGVTWNKKAVEDPRLWKWMSGFEENVPDYARLSGDMVRDLALGTADQYWWAIAYESDAIRWMQAGKPLEVFYLPRTNYADHPLCFVDYKGMDGRVSKARAALDTHLRSAESQKLLLQNGFRPTEIEISQVSKNNPFRNPALKKRGLREKGFRVDQRINYRILNHLNAQWNQRF